MARAKSSKTSNNSANIGFEAKLWLAADSRSEAETAEGNRSGNMYATTRRLAMMNLAIRDIESDLGEEQADTFRRDLHPDLREFAFIFLKMYTARREQHEETGNASCAFDEARHRVENGASRAAATSIAKPRGRLSGREGVKDVFVDRWHKKTRKLRWKQLEHLAYTLNESDLAISALPAIGGRTWGDCITAPSARSYKSRK